MSMHAFLFLDPKLSHCPLYNSWQPTPPNAGPLHKTQPNPQRFPQDDPRRFVSVVPPLRTAPARQRRWNAPSAGAKARQRNETRLPVAGAMEGMLQQITLGITLGGG